MLGIPLPWNSIDKTFSNTNGTQNIIITNNEMSVKIVNNKTVDFLDDINAKYATLEWEIDQKLASM